MNLAGAGTDAVTVDRELCGQAARRLPQPTSQLAISVASTSIVALCGGIAPVGGAFRAAP